MTTRPERITLREWRADDAPSALAVYGHPESTRWLSPDMTRVPDLPAMRLLLARWIAENDLLRPSGGRWAVCHADDGRVIGGAALLPLPPGDEDWGISWHLHPDVWDLGHEEACALALASLAFDRGHSEIFALVRPDDAPVASAVRRNGMHWVGETDKYFDVDLQVFRLRRGDFDHAAPEAAQPPS